MFTNAAVSHMIEYRFTCKRKLIHYISILLHRSKSTLSKYMLQNPQLISITTYFWHFNGRLKYSCSCADRCYLDCHRFFSSFTETWIKKSFLNKTLRTAVINNLSEVSWLTYNSSSKKNKVKNKRITNNIK